MFKAFTVLFNATAVQRAAIHNMETSTAVLQYGYRTGCLLAPDLSSKFNLLQ